MMQGIFLQNDTLGFQKQTFTWETLLNRGKNYWIFLNIELVQYIAEMNVCSKF